MTQRYDLDKMLAEIAEDEAIESDSQKGKEFTKWKTHLISNWDKIKFVKIVDDHKIKEMSVGGKFIVNSEIDCAASGQFGYTLRILPKHSLLINPFELGLIKWAD